MPPLLALLSSLLTLTSPNADYLAWRVGDTLLVADRRVELGIGMHAMPDNQIALVKQLGVRLVRHTMYWGQIENTTAPGVYDPAGLAEWDDLVKRCDAAGIILDVVVHSNAPGCSYANRTDSYVRFAKFMAFVSARYPSIRYWELWNEMDGAFTDLFGAQAGVPLNERGRMYAEMLKLAYPAIKQANPRAFVVSGGMTDWREFPQGIYDGGGRDYFDIMSLHTYGVPVDWAFVDRGLSVRGVMARNGDAAKPLWNTEFGIDAGNLIGAWGYPHDAGKPDAATLDQLMLDQWKACLDAAQRYGIYQKILPYQFAAGNERDDDGKIRERAQLPAGMTIDDYGFGIVRRDGLTPRPVYDWLKERDFNRPFAQELVLHRDVEFWSDDAKLPPGAAPNPWRPGYAILPGLPIDSAVPTILPLTKQE